MLAFPKFLLCLANDGKTQNYDLRSLRYAVTAGQVVGPSFVASVKTIPSLHSLFLIYGLTEVGLVSVNADWISLKKRNVCQALDGNLFSLFVEYTLSCRQVITILLQNFLHLAAGNWLQEMI